MSFETISNLEEALVEKRDVIYEHEIEKKNENISTLEYQHTLNLMILEDYIQKKKCGQRCRKKIENTKRS